MNRIEKCKLSIEKGYNYNSITGEVKNLKGIVLNSKDKNGYKILNIIKDKKKYVLFQHQFAWYYTYGEIVECLDHINRKVDDNRISNLRSVTKIQNGFNQNRKGYSFNKQKNKWISRIKVNNKSFYLGLFDNEEDAREVYLKAKKTYHSI
jgi:hypothetical protein